MVNLRQVVIGTLSFIENNIINQMPSKSPKRLGLYIMIGLIASDLDNACTRIQSHKYYIMAKEFGVIDENDSIDLDKAEPIILNAVSVDGLELTMNNGSSFEFNKDDISKLINTIKSVRV